MLPFVIYADFEAITEKIKSCQPNNDKSYTNVHIKSIQTVDMAIRLYVVMMINIVNL